MTYFHIKYMTYGIKLHDKTKKLQFLSCVIFLEYHPVSCDADGAYPALVASNWWFSLHVSLLYISISGVGCIFHQGMPDEIIVSNKQDNYIKV